VISFKSPAMTEFNAQMKMIKDEISFNKTAFLFLETDPDSIDLCQFL